MSQDRFIFQKFISDSLAKNPSWLPSALDAISGGMQRAIDRLNEDRARYDLAFRSALILAAPNRVTAASREILNDTIVRAIKSDGLCQAERDYLERNPDLLSQDETAI